MTLKVILKKVSRLVERGGSVQVHRLLALLVIAAQIRLGRSSLLARQAGREGGREGEREGTEGVWWAGSALQCCCSLLTGESGGTSLHRRYLACTFFALHTVYLDIWQLNCTFFAHLLSDLFKQAFQRDLKDRPVVELGWPL